MASSIPSSSSASHHTPLEPISGTTLLAASLARRAALAEQPSFSTGCAELDRAVLLGGGFERGCVVGVSAEEDGDEVGLVLGLQVVARSLLAEQDKGMEGARVIVVTPMGVVALVGALRNVLRGLFGGGSYGGEREREMLGRVSVARVFDVFGLWEVLGEVDGLGEGGSGGTPEMGQRKEASDDVADGADLYGGASVFKKSGDDKCEDDHASHDVTPERHRDDHAPSLATSPPAHQPTGPDTQEATQLQEELPSSPLSDPPSSLSETPPWLESVRVAMPSDEEVEMDAADQPRRTPPGLREEIQDSQDEADEVFLSPLVPDEDESMVTTEEQELSSTELAQHQDGLAEMSAVAESNNHATPPAAQPYELEGPSAATASAFDVREQDDEVSRQPTSADEPQRQEDSPLSDAPSEASLAGPPEHVNFNAPAPQPASREQPSRPPDIILITHMSTLLSALFHQRDKATGHQTLQLLASRLRYMSRSPEHGGPLIMILNSTTSSDFNAIGTQQDRDRDGPPRPPPPPGGPRTNKPLDPTLRSIFNPPPLPVSGLSYSYDTPHSRRNKPSFGLIFTQILDMHLLCTKIPKTRADAEALYAPPSPGTDTKKKVGYVWAVEVLLDEMGLWEGAEKVLEGKPRRSREQRWGAVEVRRDGVGVRLVDAFQKKVPTVPKEIVLSAGFGGRRG